MNYDRFINIKIKELELIRPNKLDCVYNLLTKNGITNLKELFELDDLNLIEYGKKTSLTDRVRNYQTKGIIKLIRAKYLNEELKFDNLLDCLIINGSLYKDEEYKNNEEFVYEFLNLGLTFNFIINLRESIKNINYLKVIDVLKLVYLERININNTKDLEKNKNRLKIIIDNYKEDIKTLKKR